MGSEVLNLALDALMIIAITGLWVMWFQQAGQRKKVEKMLLQASEELQAATLLLDQVMESMAAQKSMQQNVASQALEKEIKQISKQNKADDVHAAPSQVLQGSNTTEPSKNATAYSAQIMRLNREGLPPEGIADKLEVPIAQVRLMLLLQKPKNK